MKDFKEKITRYFPNCLRYEFKSTNIICPYDMDHIMSYDSYSLYGFVLRTYNEILLRRWIYRNKTPPGFTHSRRSVRDKTEKSSRNSSCRNRHHSHFGKTI